MEADCTSCGKRFMRHKGESSCGQCREARDVAVLRLARSGRSLRSIAAEVGCSERWVARVVRAAGDIPIRPAACSPERRALSAERRRRAAELKKADAGLSAEKIGERIGVGETQALRLLHNAGIATPRKPPPEAGRLAANEATREAIRERDRRARELGLWTTQDVERQTILRGPSIVHLRRGEEPSLPPALWIAVKEFRFPLYRPYEVKLHQRRRRLSEDHRVLMHRDPELTRRWARTLGLSRQKTEELAARAAARHDVEKRVRAGLRPAEERHGRWRNLLAELQDERPEATASELYGLVALVDWQRHPKDWSRRSYPAKRDDPLDFADRQTAEAARDRVRKALAPKRAA